LSDYSNLIIYQYAKKPKALATINAILSETDRIIENLTDLINQWDIDQARAFSLDIIGRRVGVSRTLPAFVSKGYLGYYESIGGQPWGQGIWYKQGESTGGSLVLGDEDYRFLIRAKIFKNFQNGTLDYVLDAMRNILSSDANVQDNYDMTATVFLPLASLNPLQAYMIQVMDILPRPMGVMYTYTNASGREFGFDGFFNSYGFDDGSFIDA
jgi:Protein of unknown function (DUF2612).